MMYSLCNLIFQAKLHCPLVCKPCTIMLWLYSTGYYKVNNCIQCFSLLPYCNKSLSNTFSGMARQIFTAMQNYNKFAVSKYVRNIFWKCSLNSMLGNRIPFILGPKLGLIDNNWLKIESNGYKEWEISELEVVKIKE